MTADPRSHFEVGGVVRLNLCDPKRDVNGCRFTCADKADQIDTWPCTGGEHRNGVAIVCSCECHQRVGGTTYAVTVTLPTNVALDTGHFTGVRFDSDKGK